MKTKERKGNSNFAGFELEVKQFTFIPVANRKVLEDINLKINRGEFVSIVGSNAAGKSALLRAIAGELDYSKCSGDIYVAGQKIDGPINQITNKVGIIHQSGETDLIAHLSVAQNIAIRQIFGKGHKNRFFSISKSWKRDLVATLGEIPGLDDPPSINEIVKYLSGGQKQMLNVAIAIHIEHQHNPCRLLLLDEHTSKLDPINSKKVMEFTANQIRENRITSVMVTHRLNDAVDYSDRILVIKDGKKVADLPNKDKKITVDELLKIIE